MAQSEESKQGQQPDEEARSEPPPGVKLLRTLEGHREVVTSVAFDPRSELLASGSADNTAKLWDVRSGKLLHTLQGHRETIYGLALHPQEATLASGSGDGTVKLWDTRTGHSSEHLKGMMGKSQAWPLTRQVADLPAGIKPL